MILYYIILSYMQTCPFLHLYPPVSTGGSQAIAIFIVDLQGRGCLISLTMVYGRYIGVPKGAATIS